MKIDKKSVNLLVNNKVYNFDKSILSMTIFQVCSLLGIDIPCFCYQENLSIAGNCRMCLVEVSTSLKLVVSCSMNVVNDMKIFLYNFRVKKARESVLELLLANHPLECPVCDQAGECDLQDITFMFGSDKGRFYENEKRAVRDFDCGPYVKTLMTRCIHCTRCVRFLSEVSGVYDFGMVSRGVDSEISTYVMKSLNDELSGNIIDLCPVGALTSKPYSFEARHWELNSVESVDILDIMGSSIKADILNNKIVRIVPSMDANINEDWLSNKSRFSYDLLNSHRIQNPLYKYKEKFIVFSWLKVLSILISIFEKELKDKKLGVFLGPFESLNLVYKVKEVFSSIGCLNINCVSINYNNSDYRESYIIKNLAGILKNFNKLILIGINLRNEYPLINVKIRRNLKNSLNKKVFVLGKGISYLTYKVINIGNEIYDCLRMLEGKKSVNFILYYNKYKLVLNNIKNKLYKKYLFIASNSLKNVELLKNKMFKKGIWYNLAYNVTTLNYCEAGFLSKIRDMMNLKFLFLINSGNILKDLDDLSFFKIYQGSHYDLDAKKANIVLPTTYYYEDSMKYINIEGKINETSKIVTEETAVCSGIDVLKMLSYVLNIRKLSLFSNIFRLSNILSIFNADLFFTKFFNLLMLYKSGNYLKLNRKNYLLVFSNKKYFQNYTINSDFLNIYKSYHIFYMSKNISTGAFVYKSEVKVL